MAEVAYTEIAKCKVSKNRNVVVSSCSKGGYTIAQQIQVVEDGKIVSLFLKGAIMVKDVSALSDFAHMLLEAVEREQAEIAEEWDED